MKTEAYYIIALSLLSLFFIRRWILLRINIKNIIKELRKTRNTGYDRQLRVDLSDKNLNKLAKEINDNLSFQKNIKLETEKRSKILEQSVSDTCHDLRTPLTVIKGNLQLLENEVSSTEGKKYLEISKNKADDLKKMIDEFFELSVLESDSKAVELEKIDAVAFLTDFIIENETIIREKNITPEISFPEKAVNIRASSELLGRVFSNLISNTLKYASDSFVLKVYPEAVNFETEELNAKNYKTEDLKEKVSMDELPLDMECNMYHIRIGNRVKDPEAIDIQHIFDRTYRADKARTDGSAGLGLYIAKLLLEKQKAKIKAIIENDLIYFDLYFLKD